MQSRTSAIDFNPNGYFGFLNLLNYRKYNVNDFSSRTNWPPIISNPSFLDVVKNAGKPEIGLSIFLGGVITLFAYIATFNANKGYPTSLTPTGVTVARYNGYTTARNVLFFNIPPFILFNVYCRLTGQVENGQRWKVKQNIYQIFDRMPNARKWNEME